MTQHIDDLIEEKARKDGSYAIAYALLQLSRSQKDTAIALKDLNFIGERIDEAGSSIASSISNFNQ